MLYLGNAVLELASTRYATEIRFQLVFVVPIQYWWPWACGQLEYAQTDVSPSVGYAAALAAALAIACATADKPLAMSTQTKPNKNTQRVEPKIIPTRQNL